VAPNKTDFCKVEDEVKGEATSPIILVSVYLSCIKSLNICVPITHGTSPNINCLGIFNDIITNMGWVPRKVGVKYKFYIIPLKIIIFIINLLILYFFNN